MARARNPRRVMLELLKPVREDLYSLHSRWVWKGRKLFYGAPDSPDRPRLRRPDEYPEADAGEWAHVFEVTGMAIKQLERVREHAARQYRAIEARQGNPAN